MEITPLDLWDTKQAAAYLGISQDTLRLHRTKGTGPAYIPLGPGGGKVRYTKQHLDDWIESRVVLQRKTKGKLTYIRE